MRQCMSDGDLIALASKEVPEIFRSTGRLLDDDNALSPEDRAALAAIGIEVIEAFASCRIIAFTDSFGGGRPATTLVMIEADEIAGVLKC